MKTIYVERLRQVEDVWQWVPEPEQFDLEEDFKIDENNLEREMCRMGQLLVRYGTLAGELQANLTRKEEHVKLIKAKVGGVLRAQYEAQGTKITEGKLADEVIANDQYQEALRSVHVLRSETIQSEHWYRSAIKKSDMLNALAFRQNAELKRAYT